MTGNLKNFMDDRDNTRIYVLARFAVYNFSVLRKLYLFFEFLRTILRNQLFSMFWDFSNSLTKQDYIIVIYLYP